MVTKGVHLASLEVNLHTINCLSAIRAHLGLSFVKFAQFPNSIVSCSQIPKISGIWDLSVEPTMRMVYCNRTAVRVKRPAIKMAMRSLNTDGLTCHCFNADRSRKSK